ncbi:MAG TPA: hypothetical protein PKX20_05070 [Methanothrix soehngenii]|nr:hypothetical protein [Methanothrix soehngenii]
MAGVHESIIGSKRYPSVSIPRFGRENTKALELQAAMEILAEVFHVGASDVEEMIQGRMDEKESPLKECGVSETGLWPEMFWVGEYRD